MTIRYPQNFPDTKQGTRDSVIDMYKRKFQNLCEIMSFEINLYNPLIFDVREYFHLYEMTEKDLFVFNYVDPNKTYKFNEFLNIAVDLYVIELKQMNEKRFGRSYGHKVNTDKLKEQRGQEVLFTICEAILAENEALKIITEMKYGV